MTRSAAVRSLAAAVVAAMLVTACRTGRPSGSPVAPLTASTPEEALEQLKARRSSIDGTRSLMRVRATTGGKTQSFRAQLAIHDAERMELIAYTPVGTTALTLKADGNSIVSDPEIAPSAFAFLRSAGLTPAQVAILLLGVPPRDDLAYEVDVAGLKSASLGDLEVTFDPPAYPAQRVVVTRGEDRIEIEHLEVVR